MQVNVDIKLISSDTVVLLGEGIKNQPVENSYISCGYNNISLNYVCGKNEASLLKKHWKNYLDDCIITSF